MANAELLDILYRVAGGELPREEWDTAIGEMAYIDLSDADLSLLDLAEFNFEGVDLTGAKLYNCNLQSSNLKRATLAFADMRRVNLARTPLTEANLSGANLSGSNLLEADLYGANLIGATLVGVNAKNAILRKSLLQRSILRDGNFQFARFSGAAMKDADLEDADFSHASIDAKQLKSARNADAAITDNVRGEGTIAGGGGARRWKIEDDYEDLFQEADCWKILGVPEGANLDDIAKAYKKRVKEYHPDRCMNLGPKIQEVARREFDRIQHAYKSLTTHQSAPTERVTVREQETDIVSASMHLNLEQYQALAQRYPNDSRIQFNLGNKYMEVSDYDQAITAFQRAVELDANNSGAQHNLKIANLLRQLQNA